MRSVNGILSITPNLPTQVGSLPDTSTIRDDHVNHDGDHVRHDGGHVRHGDGFREGPPGELHNGGDAHDCENVLHAGLIHVHDPLPLAMSQHTGRQCLRQSKSTVQAEIEMMYLHPTRRELL